MGRRTGDASFRYNNKDSPDYKPAYGNTYTERQKAILNGELPIENVRTTELSTLSKKALQMGDTENYEIAYELSQRKKNPDSYFPPYTIEEAKAILQSLTPWEIDWEED